MLCIMYKINTNEIPDRSGLTDNISIGAVYPRAVMNGLQSGEVYTDGRSVLIWHHCGFSWLCGRCSESLLSGTERLRTAGGRRLVLFTENEKVKEYFETRGASVGRRLFFSYSGGQADIKVPEGFGIMAVGPKLFESLEGRVVPKMFWRDAEEYLKAGKGFCIMNGSKPAAWAFTASTDGKEADIGVETAEEYRSRGLASAAASLVLNAVISSGMRPVWACDSANAASQALARRLGFELISECWRIR